MNKKQKECFKGATDAICEEARKPAVTSDEKEQKERKLKTLQDLRRAFNRPLSEEIEPFIKPEQTIIN